MEGLGAIVHSGDDAVPVEGEGVGEGGIEERWGKVGKLGRDRLCFIRWVRGKEALAQMAGGDGVLVELVECGIVGVEFCDGGVDIVVDLFRKEASNE